MNYIVIARIALESNPQFLEILGIINNISQPLGVMGWVRVKYLRRGLISTKVISQNLFEKYLPVDGSVHLE